MQKRILVVDDNPGMLKLLRLFVNSDPDFQVCGEAFDGLDAVEKALELKPDLIILDFQMPRLNGIDAARVLRQRLADVPVILFTLHKDAIFESSIANSSIRAVLSKMDGLELLSGKLHSLLQ
jgi:chemotaxis response regulator CheB